MAKPKILLVDADLKSRQMLEISLKKAGFTVTSVEEGEKALQLLDTYQPELIVSDIDLAGTMDGFLFCSVLKERQEHKLIPFIFLTKRKEVEDKIRGLELGVDDYLTKPIYLKEVIARARLILDKKRQENLEATGPEPLFQGDLSQMSIVDLLQTMEFGQKTGVLHLERSEKAAKLFVRQGRVVHAVCDNLVGERAVYRVLLWNDGTFRIEFRKTLQTQETIQSSIQGLIMEGMRRIDELERIKEQLPPFDIYLMIDSQTILEEHPDRFPAKIENILAEFDGESNLEEVVEALPYDDLESLEIISKLYFQGFLTEVEPPVPADEEPAETEAVESAKPSSAKLPPASSTLDTQMLHLDEASRSIEQIKAKARMRAQEGAVPAEPPTSPPPAAEAAEPPPAAEPPTATSEPTAPASHTGHDDDEGTVDLAPPEDDEPARPTFDDATADLDVAPAKPAAKPAAKTPSASPPAKPAPPAAKPPATPPPAAHDVEEVEAIEPLEAESLPPSDDAAAASLFEDTAIDAAPAAGGAKPISRIRPVPKTPPVVEESEVGGGVAAARKARPAPAERQEPPKAPASPPATTPAAASAAASAEDTPGGGRRWWIAVVALAVAIGLGAGAYVLGQRGIGQGTTAAGEEPFTLAQRAFDLIEDGNWASALRLADEALALDPELPLAHYARAKALERMGKASDARAAYEQVLRVNPMLHVARLDLLQLRFNQDEGAAVLAEDVDELLLRIDPVRDPELYGDLVFFALRVHIAGKNWNRARTALRNAERVAPQDPRLATLGSQIPEAAAAPAAAPAKPSLAPTPRPAPAPTPKAQPAPTPKPTPKPTPAPAAKPAEPVAQPSQPSAAEQAMALHEKGISFYRKGYLRDAKRTFEEATELDPNNDEIWVDLGRVLTELGEDREAMRVFTTAGRLNPRNPRVWNNLGSIYLLQGDRERARRAFEAFLDLVPSDSREAIEIRKVLENL